MNVRRALKFRGDQERRRFFVGVAVDPCCSTATATMVAATGRGLEARFEVASFAEEPVPASATEAFLRLSCGECRHPTEIALLAAQLAEAQAAAINRLAMLEAEVWSRVLLAGATDPGLWFQQEAGAGAEADRTRLPDYLGLTDAARLAELVGLNVVDAFPARDLAHGGQGRPLDAIPLWLLAHNAQAHRLLCVLEPEPRAVFLPGTRDESGASQVEIFSWPTSQSLCTWLTEALQVTTQTSTLALQLPRASRATMAMQELVLPGPGFEEVVQANTRGIPVVDENQLGIPAMLLPAASAALLAMLHLDQVPANLPMLTGAEAPRVLGRLTPGTVAAWNRLLRDLAFVRPLITPLRAVI